MTVQTPLVFKAHHRVRGEVAGFGKVRRADDVVGASAAGFSPGVLWQDMPIALRVTLKTYAAVADQRHQRTGCEGMIPASRPGQRVLNQVEKTINRKNRKINMKIDTDILTDSPSRSELRSKTRLSDG